MTSIHTITSYGTTITVTETATASVVRKWIKSTLFFHRYHYLNGSLVVGLGVQWTPIGPNPPADTLQLCVGNRILIFHLTHAATVPLALHHFLSNPTISFVGFWNHSDRSKLENSWANLEMCRDPFDLRIFAAEAYDDPALKGASVRVIVQTCLGIEVQRPDVSMSYWNLECLTRDQLLYACTDAYCAFLIGRDLVVWDFDD